MFYAQPILCSKVLLANTNFKLASHTRNNVLNASFVKKKLVGNWKK